jgi:energy-converting hydrogenase A subunit R
VKRVFITDCEGPISKNDNAFELTSKFIPNGDKVFSLISKYDDILADVLKKPGYNPGDTLKLILPFLKAFDATDKQMREFSAANLVLISDSRASLKYMRSLTDAYIVSTSYEHYIQALCAAIDFPFESTYCTKLVLDNYDLSDKERKRLKDIAGEISQRPIIRIPDSAKSVMDFSDEDRTTIGRLDEIFWSDIVSMRIGKIIADVSPVGGKQKAEAIKAAIKRSRVELGDVFYVGDSITDVEAFKLVRDNGGLTLSFNGNQYAVHSAEIAVMSESNLVTAFIASLFGRVSKKEVLETLRCWNRNYLEASCASEPIVRKLLKRHPRVLPKVKIVTPENEKLLAQESSEFRRGVRGQAIGRLG